MDSPRKTCSGWRERAIEISVDIYGSLLQVYSDDLRDTYGAEMIYCFRQLCRDELQQRGSFGLAALWSHILWEIPSTALRERNGRMLDTLMTNLYRAAAGVAFATGLILLIPLIGMQVTGGVDWTLMDFVGAAILLFGTGFVFVLAARIGRSIAYRTAIGIVLAAALSLVWLELAVGVFTSLGS